LAGPLSALSALSAISYYAAGSAAVVLPKFLDNFAGAGDATASTADTGEARVTPTGIVLLAGGSAFLDENNSPDYTWLQYTGAPALAVSDTIKVTLTAYEGDSELFLYNADFTGAGTAWVLWVNDDNDAVVISQYDSVYYPNAAGLEHTLTVVAGIAPGEAVEVTITFSPNGDSVTLSCKGSSATFTDTNRPYKAQTGYGFFFLAYDQRRSVQKLEIIAATLPSVYEFTTPELWVAPRSGTALIECFGTGGRGGDGDTITGGHGGGGGAYAATTVSITMGNTYNIAIPGGAEEGPVYVQYDPDLIYVAAAFGTSGGNGTLDAVVGIGGAAINSTGDVVFSGGGGNLAVDENGAAGGAAASSSGDGADGGGAAGSTDSGAAGFAGDTAGYGSGGGGGFGNPGFTNGGDYGAGKVVITFS